MKIKLFKSNLINVTIKNNCLFLKVKDLENINEVDINKAIFIYKYFSIICLINNIRYKMIIDLSNAKYSIINIYSNIKNFIDVLNLMKPITNYTVKYSMLVFTNQFIKQVVNLLLNLYKPTRPLYLICDENDIMNLCS